MDDILKTVGDEYGIEENGELGISDMDEGYYDDVKGMTMVKKSDKYNESDIVEHLVHGKGKIHHIFRTSKDWNDKDDESNPHLYTVKFDNGGMGKFKHGQLTKLQSDESIEDMPVQESIKKIINDFKRFM
jgi:hypothetical protein